MSLLLSKVVNHWLQWYNMFMRIFSGKKLAPGKRADFPVHPFAGAFSNAVPIGDTPKEKSLYMKAIEDSDNAKFDVRQQARHLGGSLALDGAGAATVGAGIVEVASGDPLAGAIVLGIGVIAIGLMTNKSLNVYDRFTDAVRSAEQARINLEAVGPKVHIAQSV
jgi:hypothetical protein